MNAVTSALLEGFVVVSPFLGYVVMNEAQKQRERRERQRALDFEMVSVLLKEQAVREERERVLAQARQSLAAWSPIEWAEETVEVAPVVRQARKWGRHA